MGAALAPRFGGPLPEHGVGAVAALEELVAGFDGAVHSAGPEFFHFVNGRHDAGRARRRLAHLDARPELGAWVASPLAARLEQVAIGWLKELFGLPPAWGGVLTTGATLANFVALGLRPRWWGERHGVDVDDDGPARPAADAGVRRRLRAPERVKALGMLGIGRGSVRSLRARRRRPARPRRRWRRRSRELDGAPGDRHRRAPAR